MDMHYEEDKNYVKYVRCKICKCWPRFPQYLTTLIASIAMLSVGTRAGWTSNTTDILLAGQYNNIPINSTYLDLIVSLPNLSSLIFSIPLGMICDKFGRKLTLLLLMIPVIAGWLLILFATSINLLLIGRFVLGAGSGPLYALVPLYASEIAEKDIRAKLTSSFQLFIAFGVLLSSILAYVVHIKTFTIICTIIPVVCLVMFFFQPESPIYKVKENQYEEAKEILRYLRGESYDVDAEIEEIKVGLESRKAKTSFKESLKKRSTKIALIVSLCLIFFKQASGSSIVLFYTVDIFFSAGSTLNPKQATIVIGALKLISCFVSSSIIDLFPRRTMLKVSGLFSAIGLTILATYYSMKDRNLASEETLSTFGFMPLLGLSIFTVMVSLGVTSIPFIMSAELFPSEIKGLGVSFTGSFSCFLVFLITSVYSTVKLAIGKDGTFYFFAGVCLISVLFAIFVVPETKGKSLEQIQLELNRTKQREVVI